MSSKAIHNSVFFLIVHHHFHAGILSTDEFFPKILILIAISFIYSIKKYWLSTNEQALFHSVDINSDFKKKHLCPHEVHIPVGTQ